MTLRNLSVLFLILLSGLITALSPTIGLICFIVVITTICFYINSTFGFFVVYLLATLSNCNLVYDSPVRIVDERYPLIIFPVLVLSVIVVLKKISIRRVEDTTKLSGINCLLFFLMAWTMISCLWTMDAYHGINIIYNLSIGLAVYFLIIHFLTDKARLEQAFKFLIAWGVLLGVMLFISNKYDIERDFQYELMRNFSIEFNIVLYGIRPGGFAPPQIAGTILSFIFFAGIALYPKVNRPVKFLFALIGIFFISDILSTGSKGSAGAFMFGVLTFLLAYPGLREKCFITIPMFLASVVLTLIFNMTVFGADRLVQGSQQATLSISHRFTFWETGLTMLTERPAGAGVGGFAKLVDPWPGAHSYYFSVLFDLGISGLLIFALFIACMLFRLRKTILYTRNQDLRRYLYCMASILIVFLIHGIVDIAYDLLFVWMLFGTVVAVINIAEKARPTESKPL